MKALLKGGQKKLEWPGGGGIQHWRVILAFALLLVAVYMWGQYFAPREVQRYNVTYTGFIQQLDAGNIKSVTIQGLNLRGELSKKAMMKTEASNKPVEVKSFATELPSFQGEGLIDKLTAKGVSVEVLAPEKSSAFWSIIVFVLPWVLIIGVWYYIMRRSQTMFGKGGPGGVLSFGKSKAKLYDVTRPRTTFKDVAGLENVKAELMQMVDFLKDPSKYRAIGAKTPRGVLLVGPTGTGKTLLARAVAGEAQVPFFSISASEFIEMFVGVGASRVRDMFEQAKKATPSMIFIDEIDSIGRTRGTGLGGGHDEREQTLNQLLSELDGFESNDEVIVMAASNRPDVLDPALIRPGRFDRQIVVDRPGWKDRAAILRIHTRDKKLADDVDLDKVARGTPGMTGADLENLANEAALIAARKNKSSVEAADFDEARDTIMMGMVREEPMSDYEKKITAYHEAGHALVAKVLPNSDPVHKVTIIPRGMALGVTQQIPKEDRHYYPKSYLMGRLSVALAGRESEKLVFDEVSSGAQNDLKQATLLAEKMVGQWGMSDKVGPVNLGKGEELPFLGRELAQPKRYSDEMAWLMDQEISALIDEASKKASSILRERRRALDGLADILVEEEEIDGDTVDRIIEETSAASPESAVAGKGSGEGTGRGDDEKKAA